MIFYYRKFLFYMMSLSVLILGWAVFVHVTGGPVLINMYAFEPESEIYQIDDEELGVRVSIGGQKHHVYIPWLFDYIGETAPFHVLIELQDKIGVHRSFRLLACQLNYDTGLVVNADVSGNYDINKESAPAVKEEGMIWNFQYHIALCTPRLVVEAKNLTLYLTGVVKRNDGTIRTLKFSIPFQCKRHVQWTTRYRFGSSC